MAASWFDVVKSVATAVSAGLPAWGTVLSEGREGLIVLGREVESACFVYLDFSVRPDRRVFGHGVGWAPSRETFLEEHEARRNPAILERDGSLRRLRRLVQPRDFGHPALRVSTGSLLRAYGPGDPAESDEEFRARVLHEIEEAALPYLTMMLRARHGIETDVDRLRADPDLSVAQSVPRDRSA